MGNATQFEPAGNDPIFESHTSISKRQPKALPCISDVSTAKGQRPILKAMMTTACERNCHYCPFQAGRNKVRRLTFKPDELASIFMMMERASLVEGMFLSSGIIKGGVITQDKIIDTADILRNKYNYTGYLHLKVMPGAEYDQVERTMQLADRVSVNLEGATSERLKRLAPMKDYWGDLIKRLNWITQIRGELPKYTSIASQFVVGAVGDTDLELMSVSDHLYNQMGLRRAYYSTFSPVEQTHFENLEAVNPLRGFRLYQASFLLRDYEWDVEDLPFEQNQNLPLEIDPKLAWARSNLIEAPIEINRATRAELLRIPGIGPVNANKILRERSRGRIGSLGSLRAMGLRSVDRMAPFVLLDGRRPAQQLPLKYKNELGRGIALAN